MARTTSARYRPPLQGLLTSSDEAVCRSTALANNSSKMRKTPFPSRSWCMHATNLSMSLTSRQAPALRYLCSSEAARRRTSWAISALWWFKARTRPARKGILSGCSVTLSISQQMRKLSAGARYSWMVRLRCNVRICSSSQFSTIVCEMRVISSSLLFSGYGSRSA